MNLTMGVVMQDEHLVGEARERRKQSMDARERVVDTVSALLYLALAVAIALIVPNERDTDWLLVICLVVGYAVVSRVRFEYGDLYMSAEELVFVPLLFLAPLNLVPLLAALAAVMATVPEYVRGEWHRDRWITTIPDTLVLHGSGARARGLRPGAAVARPARASTCAALVAAGLADFAWALSRDQLLHGKPVMEVVENCLGTNRVAATFSADRLLPCVRGRRRAAGAACDRAARLAAHGLLARSQRALVGDARAAPRLPRHGDAAGRRGRARRRLHRRALALGR